MAVLYSNNASSTLSASITSTATSLSVASGAGALFPAPSGSDYFYITLVNSAGAMEVMKVTARSADTLTVVRGQDGTTGVAWAAGDRVELRFTKAMLDDFKTDTRAGYLPLSGGTLTGTLNVNANDGLKATYGGTDGDTWYRGWGMESNRTTVYIRPTTNGVQSLRIGYSENNQNWIGVRVDANTFTHNGYNVLNANNYTNYAAAASHTHSYLPLSGGTLTGNPNVSTSGPIDTYFTAGSAASWRFIFVDTVNAATYGVGASGFGIYRNGNSDYSLIFATDGSVNAPVALKQGGNQVLHAGNYNSYSPSLTGSGASGTWGINVSGSAASASNASNAWQLGTDIGSKANALQYWQSSGNDTLNPNTNWHYALRMSHGDAETYYSATLALDFHDDVLSFRRKVNGTNQTWRTVLHSGNFSSYALPNPGSGSSGRVLINLSGNPSWSDASFTYDPIMGQFRATNFRANVGDAAPTWNFNAILHAGNVSSYAAPISHSHSFDSLTSKTGGTGDYMTTGSFIAQGILRVQNGSADWDSLDLDANGATHIINARGAETGLSFQFDSTERMFLSNGGQLYTSSKAVADGWVHSDRDFVDGTLIQTDINYSNTNGDPFVLEIRGNSYGSQVPFDIQYQGYIYSDTIINHGGYSNGTNITGLVAINYNGNLCFWFPRQAYWQGFYVRAYSAYATYPRQRVSSISNSAKPTTAKQVDLSSNIRQSLHSGNYTSYSPTLTGGGASGTWSINVTGSATSVGGYSSDGWLRKVSDASQFQIYGNSRSIIFRTDGTTNPHGGGGYPYIWFYGGSSDSDRRMILATDGTIWSNSYGWLHTAFAAASHTHSYLLLRGTTSGNIDSDWGESSITFDPVPSGTPPLSSPNIRTLNLGNDYNRRTQLAFNYESDRAFFRRRADGGWLSWREFLHSGNFSDWAAPASHTHNYVLKTGDTMTGRLTIDGSGWTTSNRNYSNEWIEFGNYSGLYSPLNGAHFYPNNGSYGSWRIAGVRNSWNGLEFDASNTQVSMMIGTDGNTVGWHANSYGWKLRWASGTAYVHKGTYGGGTEATVLDSSNYTNYVPYGYPGWPGSPGTDANNFHSGNWLRSSFTYANNAPHTGTIVHFPSSGYDLQLNGSYGGTSLSFRNRNGDNGTWNAWNTVLHSGNYTSYAAPAAHNHSQYLPITGGPMYGTITTDAGTAIAFTNIGSGTYNKGVLVVNAGSATLEAPLMTDAAGGTKVITYLTWRGGYATQGGLKLTGGANGELGGNAILHAGNYSSYALPLSGGTLASTNDGILTLNKSSGTGWGYINFSQAGTRRFYFGLNASFEPELGTDNGGTFRVIGNMTVGGNQVLHAGNISSYAGADTGAKGNIQIFNASGTFTVPAGITKLRITAFGGGGGGASAYGWAGGSGGAGIAIVTVTPGTSYTVTIGAGGRGAGWTGGSLAGGTTSFGSLVTATGGLGSVWNTVSPTMGSFTTTGTLIASIKATAGNLSLWGGADGATSYSFVGAGGGGMHGGGGSAGTAGGNSIYGAKGNNGGSSPTTSNGGAGGSVSGGAAGGAGGVYGTDGYGVAYGAGGGGAGGMIIEW